MRARIDADVCVSCFDRSPRECRQGGTWGNALKRVPGRSPVLASHVGIVAVQDASRVARTQSLSLERCGTFGMVGRVSVGWRRSSAGPRIESKLASRFEISFFIC